MEERPSVILSELWEWSKFCSDHKGRRRTFLRMRTDGSNSRAHTHVTVPGACGWQHYNSFPNHH